MGGNESRYRFGTMELDLKQRQLRGKSGAVPVEPKTFDLLATLIRHRDRALSSQELLDLVWPGVFVSETALTTCVKRARRAIASETTVAIVTVRRHGYRFEGDVTTNDAAAATKVDDESIAAEAIPRSGPFVGREAELAVLTEALQRARSGHGALVAIAGEPGIGKTRIVEHFLGGLAGVEVLTGRCYEGGGHAFWPWVQIVRTLAARRDPDQLRVLLDAEADDIGRLIPLPAREPARTWSGPEDVALGRARLFEAVLDVLGRAAASGPTLVLFFDDLQWADPTSLLLLRALLDALAAQPIVVLATYRDLELVGEHPMTNLLAAIRREPVARHLQLMPLQAPESGRLVSALAIDPVTDDLLHALHGKTEGNPLFLCEYWRHAVEEGLVRHVDHCWQGRLGETPGEIPAGVGEVLGRRVQRLGAASQQILRAAAVCGREFRADIVARVVGKPEGDVLELLEEAVHSRLIGVGEDRSWHFSHVLVHDVLYSGLSAARRAALHRSVAEALEASADTDRVDLSELAGHWLRAARPAQAVEYALRAARQAADAFAFEVAAELLDRALAMLTGHATQAAPAATARWRCELLVALGETLLPSHRDGRSREVLLEAAELARDTGEPELFARAAIGIARHYFPFFSLPVDVSLIPLRLLEEALERLGDQSPALRARVLAQYAVALFRIPGEGPRRAAAATEAMRIGDEAPGADRVRVLDDLQWGLWDPDHLDERVAVSDALLALARQGSDKDAELKARAWRIVHHLELGDIHAVRGDLDAYAPLVERWRHPRHLFYVSRFRATLAALEGRTGDAERLAAESFESGRRIDPGMAEIYSGLQRFGIRRVQGRAHEMSAELADLSTRYPYVPLRWLRAYALTERGPSEDAVRAVQALARSVPLPRDGPSGWLPAMVVFADALSVVGDEELGRALYEQLLPYATQWGTAGVGAASLGTTARVLGRLAAMLGRWQEAERHLDDAEGAQRSQQVATELVFTRRDRAAMLLARGGSSDRAEAGAILAELPAEAAALGMNGVARDVAALRSATLN